MRCAEWINKHFLFTLFDFCSVITETLVRLRRLLGRRFMTWVHSINLRASISQAIHARTNICSIVGKLFNSKKRLQPAVELVEKSSSAHWQICLPLTDGQIPDRYLCKYFNFFPSRNYLKSVLISPRLKVCLRWINNSILSMQIVAGDCCVTHAQASSNRRGASGLLVWGMFEGTN